MSDNVTVNGSVIATDDVGAGVQAQRAKIMLGDDGVDAGNVSLANPMPVAPVGELIEALEAQRIALEALTKTIGLSMPDVAGRLRVAIDAISGSLTLATITTVATVTTVSSVTNQAQIGGYAANAQVPAIAQMAADNLRRNIQVT